MFDKLEKVKLRYEEITAKLSDPEVINDQQQFKALSKEYSDLEKIVHAYNHYKSIKNNLDSGRELLYETNDPEMKELAELEIAEMQLKIEEAEKELKELLIPKDPADSKNAIMEIRAGTGGEEASLFAAELFRMYMRYFEIMHWKTELIEYNEA